jgi:hypothetical protein
MKTIEELKFTFDKERKQEYMEFRKWMAVTHPEKFAELQWYDHEAAKEGWSPSGTAAEWNDYTAKWQDEVEPWGSNELTTAERTGAES